MVNDTKALLKTDDRIMAEDIKSLLEKSLIYSLLRSDNPASSVMTAYVGSTYEGITIIVNTDEYIKAKEIVQNSPYGDVVSLF